MPGKRSSVLRPIVVGLLLLLADCLSAAPAAPQVPAGAQPSLHFDVETATNAWLASVPPRDKARSDAYFQGGYWLILWDFLYGAGVMLLLLETRFSARLRDRAELVASIKWIQSFIYAVAFIVVASVLTFPMALYESFFRERQYGLSNQNFGGWFRDQAIGLCVGVVLGSIAIVVLFAIVRRLPRTWHLWGIVAAVAFTIVTAVIAPVFIAPLFNTYKPLENAAIKNQILSLAHQNGIPAEDVYEMDASRQSKRVSANVSGLFGTERITLNDNLLNRCSPAAILAVMGHEMGHYVLHHIDDSVVFSVIAFAFMFGLLRWALNWSLARWGARWQIRGVDDIAVLPLAVLILSILAFLFTPVGNTFTRTQEYEADIFGLNASRQPDGEAEVDLLLGEYRKLDPGPLEEFLFYDHPSGRTRIYAAMRWKAENLCLFDAALPCANPPASLMAVPTGGSRPNAAPPQ